MVGLVNPKSISIAIGLGQQLLPTITKLMGDIGSNSKAKDDLEKLRRQIVELDATYETSRLAYKQEAQRREAVLYQTLAVTSILAFAAGLIAAYFAFRFQLIKQG